MSKTPTRERILEAAERLWADRGVRGASLDEIARASGVTKPTLYYHFADKNALYTELVCALLATHATGLRRAARSGAGVRDRLRSAIAYLLQSACAAPRLLRLGGLSLSTDETSRVRSAFFRHFYSPLQQILDDGVRAGDLREIDSAFATQALLNLVEPWIGQALPGGRTGEQLADEVARLFVEGLAT